jgi:hypothetical protein
VQRWLGLNATLHETQSYRIIAEDYRKQEKTGMAVALMRVAQGKLLQIKPPGSGQRLTQKLTLVIDKNESLLHLIFLEQGQELLLVFCFVKSSQDQQA